MNYSWTKYKQNANPSEFLVEQQAKSNEQRATSNEHRRKTNEQQAKTNKQQATSKKFHL